MLVCSELHKIPEIKYTEVKTSLFLRWGTVHNSTRSWHLVCSSELQDWIVAKLCRQQLEALQIPYQHPYAKHGIVATLGTGQAPCIALRTDMDALPIPVKVT